MILPGITSVKGVPRLSNVRITCGSTTMLELVTKSSPKSPKISDFLAINVTRDTNTNVYFKNMSKWYTKASDTFVTNVDKSSNPNLHYTLMIRGLMRKSNLNCTNVTNVDIRLIPKLCFNAMFCEINIKNNGFFISL